MSRKPQGTFSVTHGYNVGYFLHYGFDNIAAADLLFKSNARYFDSAGYLAHLGMELILKAWHLHEFEQFEKGHDLLMLWNKLKRHDSDLSLEKESLVALQEIDKYFTLRYPDPDKPQEIGNDELPSILTLQTSICSQMPEEMQEIINSLTGEKKGGRILMEKPTE